MNKYFLILLLLSLSACMGGGMRGVMSDKQLVTMRYEQGFASDVYKTTIDGEYFEGKAVRADASETFATAFGSSYSGMSSTTATATVVGSTSGGKMTAVLIGSRGNTLRCLMQYADAGGFTSFGGVGECVHSDGRRLDLTW